MTSAAMVVTLKKTVPGNWVAAASQALSCGSHAHHRTGVGRCWLCSSTSVIAGVLAWSSWQKDADVKKIAPTTNVTPSAVSPTALTYAGMLLTIKP